MSRDWQVVAYTQHVPSFLDAWGFHMAFSSDQTQLLSPTAYDDLAQQRISGPLEHADGIGFVGLVMRWARTCAPQMSPVFATPAGEDLPALSERH